MDNVKYFGRLGGNSCELERFDNGEVSIELEDDFIKSFLLENTGDK